MKLTSSTSGAQDTDFGVSTAGKFEATPGGAALPIEEIVVGEDSAAGGASAESWDCCGDELHRFGRVGVVAGFLTPSSSCSGIVLGIGVGAIGVIIPGELVVPSAVFNGCAGAPGGPGGPGGTAGDSTAGSIEASASILTIGEPHELSIRLFGNGGRCVRGGV